MSQPIGPDPTRQSPSPVNDEVPEVSIAKLAIELGPIVVFLGTWAVFGIKPATMALMGVSLLALPAAHFILGRIAPMLIVTAVMVWIFGSLTLWFDDPRFIKIKPTALYIMMASALIFGLLTKRPLLKYVLGEAFKLNPDGWRVLTLRWIGFFFSMALLNEIIWRNFSTGTWVGFKTIGSLVLTALFTVAQLGLIKRYAVAPPSAEISG